MPGSGRRTARRTPPPPMRSRIRRSRPSRYRGVKMSTALAAAYSRHVTGDLDGAFAYYKSGLRVSPDRPEPWFSVAALLTDRGQHAAALACARKALGLAPEHPDALKNLGCILYG